MRNFATFSGNSLRIGDPNLEAAVLSQLTEVGAGALSLGGQHGIRAFLPRTRPRVQTHGLRRSRPRVLSMTRPTAAKSTATIHKPDLWFHTGYKTRPGEVPKVTSVCRGVPYHPYTPAI